MMKRIFGLLLVFLLGAISGAVALQFSQDKYYAGRPDFVADLPRDALTVGPAMKERILSRVPIGSEQDLLIEFLIAQGFSAKWSGGESGGVGTYLWDGPVCPERWDVYWSADRDGKIAAVDTRYRDVCS